MGLSDVVAVLQVGFSGFAFLMAGYSFKLLRGESVRDGSPRKPLLQAIQRYTNYTLAMAVLVAASKLADSALTSWNHRQEDASRRMSREAQSCRDALSRLTLADTRVATDYESLLRAVQETAPNCKTVLKALEDASE